MTRLGEGEGFNAMSPEAVDGVAKSSIPVELVRSLWRKIHSPAPSEGLLESIWNFPERETQTKRRDFWGYSALNRLRR